MFRLFRRHFFELPWCVAWVYWKIDGPHNEPLEKQYYYDVVVTIMSSKSRLRCPPVVLEMVDQVLGQQKLRLNGKSLKLQVTRALLQLLFWPSLSFHLGYKSGQKMTLPSIAHLLFSQMRLTRLLFFLATNKDSFLRLLMSRCRGETFEVVINYISIQNSIDLICSNLAGKFYSRLNVCMKIQFE